MRNQSGVWSGNPSGSEKNREAEPLPFNRNVLEGTGEVFKLIPPVGGPHAGLRSIPVHQFVCATVTYTSLDLYQFALEAIFPGGQSYFAYPKNGETWVGKNGGDQRKLKEAFELFPSVLAVREKIRKIRHVGAEIYKCHDLRLHGTAVLLREFCVFRFARPVGLPPLPLFCVSCGCTETKGCAGGCYWAADEKNRIVCSACLLRELLEQKGPGKVICYACGTEATSLTCELCGYFTLRPRFEYNRKNKRGTRHAESSDCLFP